MTSAGERWTSITTDVSVQLKIKVFVQDCLELWPSIVPLHNWMFLPNKKAICSDSLGWVAPDTLSLIKVISVSVCWYYLAGGTKILWIFSLFARQLRGFQTPSFCTISKTVYTVQKIHSKLCKLACRLKKTPPFSCNKHNLKEHVHVHVARCTTVPASCAHQTQIFCAWFLMSSCVRQAQDCTKAHAVEGGRRLDTSRASIKCPWYRPEP